MGVTGRRGPLWLVLLMAAVSAAGFARAASAEGEAGLVIQHGDGSIESFCVAFAGDSISGDQLLKTAGVAQENVNGLVCSIGRRADEGCYGAGTFESCTCKCRNPGSGCVYWSFFTQRYGANWIYSSIGVLGTQARDGEMHAWRWGGGGAASAPPPESRTFEQVCGHAPRGGIAPTATATLAAATAAPATQIPTVAVTQAPAASETSAPSIAAEVTSTVTFASPSAIITLDASTSPTAGGVLPPAAGGAPTIAEGDNGSATGVITFAAIASGLVALSVAGLAWRRRHGG